MRGVRVGKILSSVYGIFPVFSVVFPLAVYIFPAGMKKSSLIVSLRGMQTLIFCLVLKIVLCTVWFIMMLFRENLVVVGLLDDRMTN